MAVNAQNSYFWLDDPKTTFNLYIIHNYDCDC